ncbi:MAG: metallophosphoesterase [Spirochaetales bacterium]|nr:metallophosphoesterase [Spirochaetales bacterium]
MKILCIADHKDPLVYSPRLKERYGDVDFILSAGDLDLEYYGYIVSMLNKPLYYVFGNHNLKYFIPIARKRQMDYPQPAEMRDIPSFGSRYIGGKVVRQGKLLIAGIGGSLRYNRGENQYTDFQMYLKVAKLIPRLLLNKIRYGRYLDIFLTHAPPLGIHDQPDRCHTGFKAFVWFLEKFRPRFMIHGHIHIYDLNKERKEKFNDTIIFNAFNHVIVDTEKDYE